MSDASIVVCRAGYSSIMDLLKLQKKALLIPTPGQTEQLYLAEHLKKMNLFAVQKQEDLILEDGIDKCKQLSHKNICLNFEGYKKAIDDLGI